MVPSRPAYSHRFVGPVGAGAGKLDGSYEREVIRALAQGAALARWLRPAEGQLVEFAIMSSVISEEFRTR